MTATCGFSLEAVLEKFPNESFIALNSSFGYGVDADSFVAILMDECAKHNKELRDAEGRAKFEPSLRQLFTIIDVNNNGEVSWEEFSHYIMYAIQAPEISEKKEIVQHIAFDYLGRCPVESTRLRSVQVDFSAIWDKYILLECGASTSRLALYTRQVGQEAPFRTYAEYVTSNLIESIAFIDTLRLVAATTTNGKLQMFDVSEDPVLEEAQRMQRMTKVREHHLEGRNTILRFDPETKCLFAGSRDGIVTMINPDDDTRVVPSIVQQVRLHRQPILDLCVLPERGNKKLLTTALDGKIQMYDIVRTDFYGELGNAVAAHSMSFCEEYSVLVTCSNKDLDPLMWAPHAVSNVYVGRLESSRPGHRSRLVSSICPKGTPYCFTTDVQGQIKLWDLRKLKQVVSFYADGDAVKNEMSAQLTMRSLVADARTLDIMSFCRSEFGNGLEFCKSKLVASRDPCVTHDDQVVGCSVVTLSPNSGWFCTASEDCVKLWDSEKGEVVHHFKNILPSGERITAFASDLDGRRMFIGTLSGAIHVISTATCGSLGEATRQQGGIVSLSLRGHVLLSLSSDGAVTATDVSGDAPVLLFACRRDILSRGTCMDVSQTLSCIVTGFENGWLEFNDCAEHSHGASMGYVKPMDTSRSSDEDDDVSRYMLPKAAEITALKICAPRAFVCYGDTRGGLCIIATRPHPKAMMRMAWWKTFFPKATSTFFAVPLSIDWRDETCTLVVGDDQGNVTLWDCTEVLKKYSFVRCAFPAPMKELLALPKPTETPMVFSPKLRGYFTLSPTLTPIRILRLLFRDIFMIADEKCVYFGNLNGDVCGILQQGRGTVMASSCDDFDLEKEESENEDDETEKLADTNFESEGSLNKSLNRSSMSVSLSALRRDLPPFVAIADHIYQDICRSFRVKSTKSAAAQSTKLTMQDEIIFDADTPPPTPLTHFQVKSRVLSKFPRAVAATVAIGGQASPMEGKYFNPLKGGAHTSGDAAPPFSQPTKTTQLPSAAAGAHQSGDDVVNAVVARLLKLTDDVRLAPNTSIIASRPQPLPLRPPTMAAVFSGEQSWSSDWRAVLLQHPHHTKWIQQSVTKFDAHAMSGPRQSLIAPTIRDPTAPPPQKRGPGSAARTTSFCHGSLGSRSVSRRLGRSIASSSSTPLCSARAPQPDSEPATDGALSNFQLPVSHATTWTDPARDDILNAVKTKVDRELARRAHQQQIRPSSGDGPASVLRAVVRRCSTPQPQAPEASSGAFSLPPRPATPSMHFGQSKTLQRMSKPVQWSSAIGPLNQPAFQCATTTERPRTSSAQSLSQPPGGSRNRPATSASSVAADRREYVQFLLHLPRLKEAMRVAEEAT